MEEHTHLGAGNIMLRRAEPIGVRCQYYYVTAYRANRVRCRYYYVTAYTASRVRCQYYYVTAYIANWFRCRYYYVTTYRTNWVRCRYLNVRRQEYTGECVGSGMLCERTYRKGAVLKSYGAQNKSG
jgi:hypothetical protein